MLCSGFTVETDQLVAGRSAKKPSNPVTANPISPTARYDDPEHQREDLRGSIASRTPLLFLL